MGASHERARPARVFWVAPYRQRGDGRLEPEPPAKCLWADESADAAGTDPACVLTCCDWRERVTGPAFALCVLRCRTHHHAATVYPPGFVPYSRRRIVPVTEDGALVRSAGAPELAWAATLMAAPIDASQGCAWPRAPSDLADRMESKAPSLEALPAPASWRTQGRWIARSARIVGLDPATSDTGRIHVASVLGVPALGLRDAASNFAGARGYRARGRSIVSVLDRLPRSLDLAERFVAAGVHAGVWSVVIVVARARGRGRGTTTVFRAAGTVPS